jgi:hypothetical protein
MITRTYPGKVVFGSRLRKELLDSSASESAKTAFDGVRTFGDTCLLDFDSESLSEGDIAAIDAVVAAHVADLFPETIRAVVSVEADYSMTYDDYLVLADTTAGQFTITLPSAVSQIGKVFVIKKVNSAQNRVYIQGSNDETLDGATSKNLRTQWTALEVISDGDNWIIL